MQKKREAQKRENERKRAERDRVDLNIWAIVIFLCCFGLIMVLSASSYVCAISEKYNCDALFLFKKQAAFMALGFGMMMCARIVNYSILEKLAGVIYLVGIGCIFLLKTPLGVSVNGATRWLNIGVQFQVAEAVKIAVIVTLAYLVKKYYSALGNPKLAVIIWIIGGIPAALLFFVSNDLSSAIVVLGVTFMVSFICTKTWKIHVLALVSVFTFAGIYVYNIARALPTPEELDMLPFRVGRIAAWIDPYRYASDQGYQVLQSMYAIGSGGFLGKGLGNSAQKLGPIPEAQNDMIFSIICEELGVLGALAVVAMIGYLLYHIMKVAMHAKEIYGSVLALGVFWHIALQTFINIAVNCNFFPNTGLPLPFFSYGGTSIFLLLIEIAIVLSVEYHNV